MKRLPAVSIPLFVAFTLAVAPTVLGGEEINESRDAAANGLVEIISARGELEVIGWDENRIEVEGELDDLAEEFIFDTDDTSAHIEVRMPHGNIIWGDGSDLTIHVPVGSRVSVEAVSSDAFLRRVKGGIRIRSASGDITAEEIGGQINLKTVSGDIEVEESSGKANVVSVSGEIDLEISSTVLILDTVSGDVEVQLAEFERLTANAISGDIEITGQLLESGDIEIASVSSDVVLGLRSPVDALLSIQTGPGGDISNRLTDDQVESGFPATKSLRARLGDGSANINLRTVSGDITLDDLE